MPDGGGGRTYGDFATARAAVVGMVAAVSPWTGALAAAADAEMARRAEPPENVAAKAISNALHEHVGRRTWENLRVLVEELTGAEGYLPPELRESEQFMQAFAVCG